MKLSEYGKFLFMLIDVTFDFFFNNSSSYSLRSIGSGNDEFC